MAVGWFPRAIRRRLAAALVEILGSTRLQCVMGAENRARVEQVFDIEKAVDRLEAVYEATLSRVSRSAARVRLAGGSRVLTSGLLQLGFAAAIALALAARLGALLQYLFPIAAVLTAVLIERRSLTGYLSFVIWLWMLTPSCAAWPTCRADGTNRA
jgi:hypothetical protein